MTSIVLLCAGPLLGQVAPPVDIADVLRQSPAAEYLARPIAQLPVGQSPRLEGVTLDLAAHPTYAALSDRDGDPTAISFSSGEETTGLALRPEKLAPFLPEGTTQDEVKALLAALCVEKSRQFRVDIAFVPPEALDGSVEPPQLESAIERAGDSALRLTLVASNEQTVHASTARHRKTHRNDNVNQTGTIPVANVVIDSLPLGFTVEAQPHTVGWSPFVELRLRVWKTAERGKAAMRVGLYSQHEVVSLEERSLETELLIPLGKAAVAGSFNDVSEGGKARSFAVLARVDSVGDRDARVGGRKLLERSGLELRAFDVGFLRRALERRQSQASIVEQIRTEVESKSWEDSRTGLLLSGSYLFVTAPAALEEATAAWLEERRGEVLRSVSIEARVLEGPVGRLLELRRKTERGFSLSPRDLEAEATSGLQTTFRSTARGLPGATMRFRGIQVRSYVRSLSLASSACFLLIDMPEESLQLGGDGFEGAITLDDSARPCFLDTHVRWIQARTRFERQVPHRVYPLNTLQVASGGGDASQGPGLVPTGTAVFQPPALCPIDLPEGDTLRARLQAALEDDRWTILKLENVSGGRGRMLVARTSSSPAASRAAKATAWPPTPVMLDACKEGCAFHLPTLRNSATLIRGLDGDDGPVENVREPPTWAAEWTTLKDRFAASDPSSEALRRQLEKHWTRCVTVEAAFVSAASVPQSVPGSSPWLSEEAFDRACRESQPPAEIVVANASMGARLRALPRGTRRQLVDQQVSQGGFFPVVEPVVTGLPDGVFVEAVVYDLPDESLLRVDLRVDRHSPDPKIERRRLPDGDIELATGSSRVFAGCIVVPPGKTVVAGSVQMPGASGPDGFLLLVRVTPWDRKVDSSGATPPPVECIDTRALSEPLPHSHVWDQESALAGPESETSIFGGDDVGPVPLSSLKAAMERIQASPDIQWASVGGSILVGGNPASTARARETIAALARPVFRSFLVDLWQGTVDAGALDSLTSGAGSRKEWLDRMSGEGLRVRALCTAGAGSSIAGFAARAYVSDVDRYSGGSGFSITEVADVEVRTVSEGFTLDVHVDPIAETDTVELSLLGELARKPTFERSTWTSNPRASASAALARQPTAESVPDRIQIDLPDEDSDRWRHLGPVPLGRPVLIQALPDPAGPRLVRPIVAVVTEVKTHEN